MKKLSTPAGCLLISFGILFSLVLILVVDSSVQKVRDNAENQEKIRIAEQNAVKWIQNKYGISAQAVSSEVEGDYGLFYSDYLDTIIVTMQTEEKEFSVEISGTEEHAKGTDDYQHDEIAAGIMELISQEIPDGTLAYFRTQRYQTYFDGTNLSEVLGNSPTSLYVGFVDTDFSENVPVFNTLMRMNVEAVFTSFTSPEILEEALACRYKDYAFSNHVNYFAPYITNQRYIDFPKNQQRSFSLYSHDDFLYMLPYENITEEPVTFQKADSSWIHDKTLLSDVYQISDDYIHAVIYYPLEKLQNAQDIEVVYRYDDYDDSEKTETEVLSPSHYCGAYAVFEIWHGKNFRFAFCHE